MLDMARLPSPLSSLLPFWLSSLNELAVLSRSFTAWSASWKICLRAVASSATDFRSWKVPLMAAMFLSDSSRLTRSSASTARWSTVPPPSSRSARALCWVWITGTVPEGATVFSSGLDWVPPVIWM